MACPLTAPATTDADVSPVAVSAVEGEPSVSDDDSPTLRCEPFCSLAHARAHCLLCKCAACSFCASALIRTGLTPVDADALSLSASQALVLQIARAHLVALPPPALATVSSLPVGLAPVQAPTPRGGAQTIKTDTEGWGAAPVAPDSLATKLVRTSPARAIPSQTPNPTTHETLRQGNSEIMDAGRAKGDGETTPARSADTHAGNVIEGHPSHVATTTETLQVPQSDEAVPSVGVRSSSVAAVSEATAVDEGRWSLLLLLALAVLIPMLVYSARTVLEDTLLWVRGYGLPTLDGTDGGGGEWGDTRRDEGDAAIDDEDEPLDGKSRARGHVGGVNSRIRVSDVLDELEPPGSLGHARSTTRVPTIPGPPSGTKNAPSSMPLVWVDDETAASKAVEGRWKAKKVLQDFD